MSKKIIILGANGRFGRAALQAFAHADWQVTAYARRPPPTFDEKSIHFVKGDLFDKPTLYAALKGQNVILNALTPPYPQWASQLPRQTKAVLDAANSIGATIMLPGNIYSYGENMPPVLTENTVPHPTEKKGRLRQAMEEEYARACVQTIILRSGDFIERQKTGNWFDSYIAASAGKGEMTYPGPLNVCHSWSYLPDMARAMVGLAERRTALAGFETFGFRGYALTGGQLVAAMEMALSRPLKTKKMPWRLMRLMALVNPTLREVIDMAYLWRVPHEIDERKLLQTLPHFRPTPLKKALTDALHDHLKPH